MIPLAIWVFLIGYTVAWTGRMNWGLRYEPQADGTIKVVDSTGNESKTWSLTDAVTCGQASVRPAVGRGQPTYTGTAGQAQQKRTGDCAPRPGDVNLGPFIWRPLKLAKNEPSFQTFIIGGIRRVVDTANGQLIGPC